MARQRPRRDWNEIRAAYRRGEGTLRALAKRFGMSASSVMKRAAADGWEAERQRVESGAQEKAVAKDTESLAQMLAKHRRFSSRLLELGAQRLEEAAKGHVSASMLETLASVLTRAARQERLAAGIEPAKPVMGFETASAGAVLRVKRRPAAEQGAPGAATAGGSPVTALPKRDS